MVNERHHLRMQQRGTALCCLLLCATAAWADFKREYSNGLRAIREENWSAAISALQKAIDDNPVAAERVRMYGMRFEDYLPHYYLGEARFRMGDCSGAISAWDEAIRQGPVKNGDLFSQLERNRRACAASAVDVSALVQATEQAAQQLTDAIERFKTMQGNPLLSADWKANPAWQRALDDAQAIAAAIPQRIANATASNDANGLQTVADESTAASNELIRVTQGAITRLAALEQQEQRNNDVARLEMIQAIAAARPASSETAPDARSQSLQDELTTLIQREVDLGTQASAGQYQRTTRAINAKLREYRQAIQDINNQQRAIAARTPPAVLKQAATAYFVGQYNEAAELANPGNFGNDRERIQAHLFRAASRFHLYVLGGQQSDTLLRQAENDIRSIKRLDRNFAPYLAAFPPKFMSLFNQTL